jgi:hypothetical protein
MPLTLDEPGFETVANGMIDIFPSLIWRGESERGWEELSERIEELQKVCLGDAGECHLRFTLHTMHS